MRRAPGPKSCTTVRAAFARRPGVALGLAAFVLACAPAPERAPKDAETHTETHAAPPAAEPAAPSDAPGEAAPSALAPSALPDFADPAWTRVASRAGRYLVCWRTPDGKVPRNQDFELEVWVLHDGAPVRDAVLSVSGWMPEHAHGMLRAVRPEARGDGSFRVVGMLLHMRGHWLLRFDVLEGTLSETAECALDL